MNHITTITVNSQVLPLSTFGNGVVYNNNMQPLYPAQYATVIDGALKVTGTFNVTLEEAVVFPENMVVSQLGTWNVAVSNFPETQAVSIVDPITVSQDLTWDVNALQSGPWTVGATQDGPWSVDASCSQSGVWTVAATQSGTWDISNISGTISLPTGAATETTLAAISGKLPATLGQKFLADSLPVAIASDQSPIQVQANGGNFTNRKAVRFYAIAAVSGATTVETAITLTRSENNAATTTGVSHPITTGRRLVITSLTFAARGHSTATAQVTAFRIRVNPTGAVITSTTPIELVVRVATPATANAWDRVNITIPEGWEIAASGGVEIGVTAAATYVTNAPTWDVAIIGFEYIP